MPFTFSACSPFHFLSLISLISVHFYSITSFVFHSSPPSRILNGNKASCISVTLSSPRLLAPLLSSPPECLRALLLNTCCSLHPLSPWKHLLFSFSPLLIPSVLSSQLSASDSIPSPVISPPYFVFFFATSLFISPCIASSTLHLSFLFSQPSDSASHALSHRCVWSVSPFGPIYVFFLFFLSFIPFSILSPSSLVSLPHPEETVT